jgi:hypothetical protein
MERGIERHKAFLVDYRMKFYYMEKRVPTPARPRRQRHFMLLHFVLKHKRRSFCPDGASGAAAGPPPSALPREKRHEAAQEKASRGAAL